MVVTTMAWLAAAGLAQIAGAEVVSRPSAVPGEATVDAVVASVEPEGGASPRYALRSEYVLMLRADLMARGAPDALTAAVDPSVAWPVLEWLLGEHAVVREAERAGAADPEAGALSEVRARLVARLGGDAGLAALLRGTGASPGEFDALVRRRAVVLAWLVSRHARLIEPEESALRQAHEAGRFAALYREGASFAEAREVIRRELVAARFPAALRQYLRGLGSRARLRVFVSGDGL